MAVAAVPVKNASTVFGNKRIRVYDLNFTGNYATGGETVTASSVGLRKIDFVNVQGHVAEGSTPTLRHAAGTILRQLTRLRGLAAARPNAGRVS